MIAPKNENLAARAPQVATLRAEIAQHPYPLLFITISGAHLYGFPSDDSDYDLRGVHVLPVSEVIRLTEGRETIEASGIRDECEIDFITHDVKKFFGILLKKNGYALEQLYSPLTLHATPEYEELKEIAKGCVTRHHSYHYLGFAETQWKLFVKERPHRVKPLLYVYRVLLTGIHLMRTGEIEANLGTLNADFQLPWIDDLIARKLSGEERQIIEDTDVDFHRDQFEHLREKLANAFRESALPNAPLCQDALDDLLVRIRLSVGK